jgi:hypothetical protein
VCRRRLLAAKSGRGIGEAGDGLVEPSGIRLGAGNDALPGDGAGRQLRFQHRQMALDFAPPRRDRRVMGFEERCQHAIFDAS